MKGIKRSRALELFDAYNVDVVSIRPSLVGDDGREYLSLYKGPGRAYDWYIWDDEYVGCEDWEYIREENVPCEIINKIQVLT